MSEVLKWISPLSFQYSGEASFEINLGNALLGLLECNAPMDGDILVENWEQMCGMYVPFLDPPSLMATIAIFALAK